MDIDRLARLLDLYLDEGLDPETKRELEEMLLASPKAREFFWQRAELNAHLRQHGQEAWGIKVLGQDGEDEDVLPTVSESRQAKPVLKWIVAGLAASLMLAMVGSWILRDGGRVGARDQVALNSSDLNSSKENSLDGGQSPSVDDERPVDGLRDVWVAVLRKAVDVEWKNPLNAPSVGEPMKARRIQFENGLIEIQTNRGARIVLKGPADLEVISDMEIRCEKGRLSVDVPPPAQGFLVHTPLVKVVDRGTAFAMDVRGDATAEVHVIDGLVELSSQVVDLPMRELREGEAVGVATDGIFNNIPAASESFPSTAEINSRTRAVVNEMRQSWKQRRRAISNDPSCIVYFDFERSNDGPRGDHDTMVRNHARDAEGNGNGIIVGCDWTSGRWSGKRALDFKNVSDRVLFSVDGEHESLTCITSIRVGSIDRTFSSLLMSGDAVEGELQWKISRTGADNPMGRLRLARRSAEWDNSVSDFLSDPVIGPQRLGTWMQLAFVWDGINRTCSQYIDGELVSHDFIQTLPDSSFLRTGQLELGNWTPRASDEVMSPVRNFNGRMDEFVMFNRAFSQSEILAFHDLKAAYWKGQKANNWSDPSNWFAGVVPTRSDDVYIDASDEQKAVFDSGATEVLSRVIVGSKTGRFGELEISGGSLFATRNSDRHTRVGVAGGVGIVTQSGGEVDLNTLQIGLDPSSQGTYQLSGGSLLLSRGVSASQSSLEIGPQFGRGLLEISGGTLMTRRGVTLGRDGGTGVFFVRGSKASRIDIGSFRDFDGFWLQNTGSTLKVRVDDEGVSQIRVHETTADGGANVHFSDGALLDVGFEATPSAGEWDILKWDGDLIDEGLQFASHIDTDVWSFSFVDTDSSGSPDTLRITAQP
ncbi:LamG-like jellyroll fold domain-containing protein [Rhodopirellula sp. SWK7]|uniref:LamG-like jellyroll fold domain-containing protein n=1 Tax=Rhodopirellula sp. SWK7 TaxID=595460 RepID=UPI0002C03D33|nr:LamG-like jellyroll fold domain-containing protein [Rhodopirellula sp. SWK7]EMI46957.1 FecR protein domain protein [Rhodopirellula sp. SWK7]